MEECAGQVSVLVIATPWKQFRALRPEHLRPSDPRPVVIDWWRILPREIFEGATEYIACGQGPSTARAHKSYAADGVTHSV
jgi:hypothetical protein